MATKHCTPQGQPVRIELPDTRQDDEQLAALAKALGHPVRVRILRILASREACICGDLVDELPIAQSTVSQHLKILKEAGLVQGEIDGPRVCYCIKGPALEKLKELVADL
jgi:ArsR family transcriptional regulator